MGTVEVLSRTQRIIVGPSQSIVVVNGGAVVNSSLIKVVDAGPQGPPGPQGLPGTNDRVNRWYGEGPPGTVIGAAPGDEYVDTITGDLYYLQ